MPTRGHPQYPWDAAKMHSKCDPEVVANFSCHTGENPLWHPDERCLYWVDIPAAKLFRFHPETGETAVFHTGSIVGGITIHEDGRLLLFMADGVVKLWQDGSMDVVVGGLPGEEGNRFNDVIADPEGRVFCGVMSTNTRKGRLYRLDPDGSVNVVIEDTTIANGMGFSPDLKQLYFSDSGEGTISVFDYDRDSGALRNRRLLAKPPSPQGLPDGMTVDAEGFIWSARWDGSRLVRMSPEGQAVQHVPFPTKKISSLTFGGDSLTDIYVTTAGGEDPAANGELAGALFRLNLGVKGRPEFRSRTA
jgi:sugar lactone lactonase YvrE